MTNLPTLEDRIGMPNRYGWDPERVIDQRLIGDVPVRVRHQEERVFITAMPEVDTAAPVLLGGVS